MNKWWYFIGGSFAVAFLAIVVSGPKVAENLRPLKNDRMQEGFEVYTDKEREIIKKTILNLGIEKDKIDEILIEAERIESDSNQLLEFTKDIKQLNQEDKIKIIESLWKIIYSDKESDIYEANLMRRLTGLLYLDNKVVGNIKEKIIKDLKN